MAVWQRLRQPEAVALTRRALDLGINLIDTAEIYGLVRSERIVGAAIADRRDQVFLATKLFPVLPLPPVVRQRGRASARRLGVRWIDLYQLHAPNPVIPLSQAMRGFADLVADGLVRDVGVSNCSLEQWQEAESAPGQHRAVKPGPLQPRRRGRPSGRSCPGRRPMTTL